LDPSLAEPKGWSLRRWLAPFAVAIALLSAFLTFVVLTGLTPIEPKRDVVYSFLLINAATILLLVGIIVREVWKVVQARRRGRPLFDLDRSSFRQLLTASAASRNLPGAMLIDNTPNILETAQTGIQADFQTPAPEFLTGVDENEPQIAVFIEANYVAAVIRLRSFNDTFLYVARLLDPRVVAQLRQTQASVAEYAALESRKLGIQVAFA